MGITKRQLRYDEFGKRLPPEYKLYFINGEYWIEKLRQGMTLLEFVDFENKKAAKKRAKFI